MKSKLSTRFIFVLGVIATVAVAVSLYIGVMSEIQIFKKLYTDYAMSIIATLDADANAQNIRDPETVRGKLLKLLLLNPDIIEVSLIRPDAKGNLSFFASTIYPPFHPEQTLQDAKQVMATNRTSTHSETHLGIPTLEVHAPLHITGEVVGVYHLTMSLTSLNKFLSEQSMKLAILILVGSIVLIVVISYLIRYMITLPLNKLITYTNEIEEGHFDYQTDFDSRDEIGELASRLSRMASRLKESYRELEKKVDEKTTELKSVLDNVQGQNSRLEDNKRAMLNLLEDAKLLEEELEKEKTSVEKKIEERTKELVEQKARLDAAISSLPEAIMVVDNNFEIVLHNNKIATVFGESHNDWTFQKVDKQFGNTFDLKRYVQESRSRPKDQKDKEIQVQSKFLKIFATPITYREGAHEELVFGSIVTITDISEAKILERSRDEFFSIASHELRTPLTAIRGNTSMILDYYAKELVNADVKDMIIDTHSASIRLISIVNDFLDMSRLELGKMEYKYESVPLKSLVKKIIAELTVNATAKSVVLQNAIEEQATAWADAGKVEQILLNLIGNALKFTENGSILINSLTDKNKISIRVEDTGKGIPVENQSLLFRKFQQAGSSTVTRDATQGTGLGLYISRLMANDMRGSLVLERSEEGKGSVFLLTLPISEVKK